MSTIILDDLVYLFFAVAISIFLIFRSMNEKHRIIDGAWLLAIGVVEIIYCAFAGVFWVLSVTGIFPPANSGWKFIPDYFVLIVVLPVLLSLGIFSIAYSTRVLGPKKTLESRKV